MAGIEWNESLNLGIKELDKQHKELIGLVNDFLDAYGKGESAGAVDKILKQLKEYAVYHFNAEEKYMEEIEYPHLAEHRQLHAALKNSVKSMQSARFHLEEVSAEEIKALLSKWLIEHILRVDYKLVQFVKKSGG
ncbi:bacteriohemerythrin [Maridesulfovibrio sp.]|uniref:bacteriohemerythrin n=1 Tax=Maridesulfovibrio sp. TaxID=2795000 RepID=UPI0029C9D6E9|nr:bacteriohemerythrin [Maridesulfovibrio sp.]